ncbi:hypothetical protein [Sulfurospirillum barnesii]|uniref:Membrane-bound protein n=1 Tax=Sulfurospirillum barnesii (strain ATCC 700032 / DSM 10660 / SES-3) TaxID=760154 RepID=I3XV71_SULBS|nr:hypothetical protein [Sulfurospirillum barnesii]AFL67845.1 hypothetical protein Sulba_0530 [Sulfurospirillum barnesii SES-3]
MEGNYLIVTIVAVILIVLISLFVIVVNLQKTVIVKTKSVQEQEEEKAQQMTIEALVDIASKRTSTRNELSAAILKVAKECPFPPKEKGLSPKSAKIYLNFILLIASHKNTDAKMIAFMNEELKKMNPSYKHEIDIYESEGIHQRSNRI